MAQLGRNLRVANNRDSGDFVLGGAASGAARAVLLLELVKEHTQLPNWSSRPRQTVPITFVFHR
jgi:hypothetical protein